MARTIAALAVLGGLALTLAGCAGGSSSGGTGTSRRSSGASSISFSDAVTSAIGRHGSGVPFSVERTTMAGHSVVAVGLFDGETVRGVYFNAGSGAFVEDRAEPPVDDEEAASLAALRDRLASTSTTLRSTLRMVEGRYPMTDVGSVALLMRGGTFLVRVVTGSGGSEVEHYHDGVTGNAASLPDAGVDAGPPDAGPVDAGRDAGPIDGGRRR